MSFVYTIGVIYLFLSITGMGFYLLLTPAFLRKPVVLLFLVPVCGLLQIAIISVYVIIANKDITYSTYVSLLVGSVTLYLSLRYKRESISAELKCFKNNISQLTFTICFVIIALIIVLFPSMEGGFLTTPYRIGIDQVGYTETAQFLFTGGTLRSAETDIMHQLDTEDIVAAKKDNSHALKFNTCLDTEFLLKALRWGYSAIIANLAYISGNENVLKVAFIGLIFNYALIFAVTYCILFYFFECSHGFSLIVSLALLLNCNLLNVYYEGQSAQIIGMPIFLIMLIILLCLRKDELQFKQPNILRLFPGKEDLQLVLFVAFLTAGLLSIYNELIFTFVVFVFLVMFLDIILTRSVKLNSTILIAISVCIGFVIIFPFSYKWLHFIISHLKNVGLAGWWQPQWAFPSEILGAFDIFANNPKLGTNLLARAKGNLLLNIILSELILAVVLVYISKAKGLDKSFWLSAPLFVFLIFIKNRYIELIHNYQYMKAYTFLLPLLFILVFASINFCSKSKSRLNEYIVKSAGYLMILLISFNGLLYINKYIKERGYVTKDMFELAELNKKVELGSYALITHRLRMDEYMLVPIIPMNWLNLGFSRNYSGFSPNIQPHLGKQVAILMRKQDLKCSSCVVRNYSDYVIYENLTFLVIDTRKKIKESYNKKSKTYDVKYFTQKFSGLE